MYRKIYRQEGGLAEEGYRAQLRQAREKAIEDWNRRTRGEAAERVRPRPRRAYRPANIPLDTEGGGLLQAIKNLKGKDLSEIFNVGETQAGKALTRVNKLASDYYDPTKGDEANLARHAGASRELANILTPPIPGGEVIGNIGANLGGIAEELRDVVERGPSHFPEAWEDIKANYQGAPIFGGGRFPDAQTAEDVFEDVYGYKVDREGNRIVDEYGGLADLPEAQTRGQKVYYTDSTGSTLYPGYLGLDYGDPGFMPDFEKKYTESPYKTTRAEWDKAWNKGVNQSVPIQPTGFEGTGYGQLSPQPAFHPILKELKDALEYSWTFTTPSEYYSNAGQAAQTRWGDAHGASQDFVGVSISDPQHQQYIENLGYIGDINNPRFGYALENISQPQPTGFEGTGYGQFSPQAAGGVYTPTGDPGLRPAGITPTTINTRPYQPLAAY
jgi:hypothetical protein